MGKYYIYRFADEDNNILYIGKTIDMQSRMRGHFYGIKNDSEQWKRGINNIEYIELSNPYDMSICEIYLIGKFKPEFNKEFKYNSNLSFKIAKFENLKWNSFNMANTCDVDEYDFFNGLSELERLKAKNLINILDGKVNSNYYSAYDKKGEILSDNWINLNTNNMNQIRKNLINIIRNILKVKSKEVLCITTPSAINEIKGRGYQRSVSSINNDPNIAKDKKFIAYIYNGYAFAKNRNNKDYADELSVIINLLQFIWRSRIREGKPIDLYIPSKRMRDLLYKYLNNEI